MPTIQNQTDLTRFQDLSAAVPTAPLRSTMLGELGLFDVRPLTTKTVFIPRTIEQDFDFLDYAWGEVPQSLGTDSKGYITLPVPHFPVQDAILPKDLDGNFNWDEIGQGAQPETLVATRTRKMKKIAQGFANLWEKSRMELIINGKAYAPRGTLAQSYGATVDYFQEFGVTQQSFAMSVNTPDVDILTEVEPIIAYIQDNLKNGSIAGRFLAPCGSNFFSKLVSHPYVKETGKYVTLNSTDEVLAGRLGNAGLGLDARYRAFNFGGILWIENRAQMPTNEARVFPTDVEGMFVTFVAPSESKFSTVNTSAQEIYYFEKLVDDVQEQFQIVAETNVLHACMYPQALVKVTIAA